MSSNQKITATAVVPRSLDEQLAEAHAELARVNAINFQLQQALLQEQRKAITRRMDNLKQSFTGV